MYLEVEVQAFKEDKGAGGVQIEPRQSAGLVVRSVQICPAGPPPGPSAPYNFTSDGIFHGHKA